MIYISSPWSLSLAFFGLYHNFFIQFEPMWKNYLLHHLIFVLFSDPVCLLDLFESLFEISDLLLCCNKLLLTKAQLKEMESNKYTVK